MIRIPQHGCLPPRCQIWTDVFQRAREVDIDDTRTTTQTRTHSRARANSLPPSPAAAAAAILSDRPAPLGLAGQLSRTEEWKNGLLSGAAVSSTAVQNEQLSVRSETGGQKAKVFLFSSVLECKVCSRATFYPPRMVMWKTSTTANRAEQNRQEATDLLGILILVHQLEFYLNENLCGRFFFFLQFIFVLHIRSNYPPF